MDDESRVKEASAILHSMMTKGGRYKLPSHMSDMGQPHQVDQDGNAVMSGGDPDQNKKQYLVLTNMQEQQQHHQAHQSHHQQQQQQQHLQSHHSQHHQGHQQQQTHHPTHQQQQQQQLSGHGHHPGHDHVQQMGNVGQDPGPSNQQQQQQQRQPIEQIFVTPEIEEVMSESEEPEKESAVESKSDIKQTPRKKRKISDYLASGIDPTKLEESVAQVLHRFSLGCECIESNCFNGLNADLVYRHRLNIAELTKAEQDMYLMGVTMASLTNPDETCRRKERQRLRAQYVFQGKKVCLDAFLYLENCTHYQLKRIRKHVMTHGVTPRIHGNHGKKPHNTFSLDIYKHAITYLENYILPYVPPQPLVKSNKVKTKKVIINLPPKITRKNIHNDYREFCQNLNPPIKVMGYSSFRHFISEQFPNLRFSKPEKPAVPKFGTETENTNVVRNQFDSDQETHEDSNPTTIPLVMTSSTPDPTPSTFSSGGNTFVITQVLPAGFVPVNLSSCQMQGFPVSMSDQTPGSNIVMAPTNSMAGPPSGHSTYTFSNV